MLRLGERHIGANIASPPTRGGEADVAFYSVDGVRRAGGEYLMGSARAEASQVSRRCGRLLGHIGLPGKGAL